MKIVKYIFFIIWYLQCLNGIIQNYSHYGFFDWVIALTITFLPNVILWFITRCINRRKQIKKETSKNSPGVPDSKIISQNPQNQYVQNGNVICRTDGKQISDKEIPYLMQIGYEQVLQAEKESPNPKFHRTTREEDLSFNFEMKYGHEISNLTDKFESLYRSAYKTNDFDEKIFLLNEAMSTFEKAKKFCYSKGKGGTIYFQDTWEYLHNSHNQCFSYLDNIQDALDDAIYLKDKAMPSIIDVIAKNDGMLQKNIYKMLPDIDRSTIQRTLKILETNNLIKRNKASNSYELHIST
ncbi:MarR family winged helix-turn-helix transcriptional regulator [Lachnospiraceae bacterium 38-10]